MLNIKPLSLLVCKVKDKIKICQMYVKLQGQSKQKYDSMLKVLSQKYTCAI